MNNLVIIICLVVVAMISDVLIGLAHQLDTKHLSPVLCAIAYILQIICIGVGIYFFHDKLILVLIWLGKILGWVITAIVAIILILVAIVFIISKIG